MDIATRQPIKRYQRQGWGLGVGLVLLGVLGVLIAWHGEWLLVMARRMVLIIASQYISVRPIVQPMSVITLSVLGLLLIATKLRKTWWRSQQTAVAQAATKAAQEAQTTMLDQLRMLEHAHLKSAVLEAQMLLQATHEAQNDEQRALRLQDVAHSLNRLYRLIVELHGQITGAVTSDQGDLSALPNDLERTLQEVTRNYRTLLPRCLLEVVGHAHTTIPQSIRNALMMVLYNALANAQRHSQAQSVRVRLAYQLESIMLTVQDDGRGFDTTRQHSGRGLHDMRSLAQQQGGDLVVISGLGRGTEIVVTIPLTRPHLGWAADATSKRGRTYDDSTLETQPSAESLITTEAHYSGGGRYGDHARASTRPAEPPWVSRNRG